MQNKSETMARLRKDILSLQGFKPESLAAQTNFGLGCIAESFPNRHFPTSALHEFDCNSKEESAASSAFVATLLSAVLPKVGLAFWVGTKQQIFPPSLKDFGINPDQVLFTKLKSEKDVMWVIEEALKCNTLTIVIGEVSDIDFNGSRRLQLLIEKTGVGCFLLRNKPRNSTTASCSRWNIKPLPSNVPSASPGLGFPCWRVDLLKVRNGKPGSWTIEWSSDGFRYPSKLVAISGENRQIKTG